MRNTFRLLAFAMVASLVTFTSCNPDDDENNPTTPQEKQTEFSYTFEDMENWTPQTILAGQELQWEGDTLVSFIVSRNYYPGLEEYIASTNDGEEIPEHALLFSIPNQIGNHIRNSCFVTDQDADNVVAIFTLEGTNTNYLGIPLTNAWISEYLNINITDLDLTERRISATITATMNEYIYVFSDGEVGNQDSKTLTITIKNYPFDNWTEMDLKKNKK